MKTSYKNNLRLNYFYSFFIGANLTSGIWMLFLASKGLSLFEIGMLEGVFHITSLIMETPTGAIADLYGRKTSRIISAIFVILSSVLMICSNNFWMFALSFVLSALSYNFESGAAEAFIYDSMKAINTENMYMTVTGYLEVIFQLASIIGLIIGGYIANNSYQNIYFVMIVIGILLIIINRGFIEPPMHNTSKTNNIFKSMKDQYVTCFQSIKSSKRLRYIILFSSIISTFITLSFFYIQILWKSHGNTPLQIGIFLSLTSLSGAIGGFYASKIEKIIGEKKLLIILPFYISFSVFFFGKPIFGIIFLCITCFLGSLIFVATRDYINKIIPSSKRATIFSLESTIFSLCMIILFPTFGKFSDIVGMDIAFITLSLVAIIISFANAYFVKLNK